MPVINTMVSDETHAMIKRLSDKYGTIRNVVEKAVKKLDETERDES